jgi:hypothetical protein
MRPLGSEHWDREVSAVTRTIGTVQHFRWLRGVVVATLILNVLDAILTLIWIARGAATEANPLLAELAHRHPVTFVAVKMALVSLGSLLLWRLRRRPVAVVAVFACFLSYYLLLLYHLRAMDVRLVDRLLEALGGGVSG